MDYGLCLPNFRAGASREGIDAAAETAERLGWSTVWTTDHLLVPGDAADDYGRIYEAILTLAWVGGRHEEVKLGTSVIVIPMRNAVIVAKELATLDALTGGRVIAGLGIGWHEGEFANVGVAGQFRVRGAYLEETIRLFRHLWSGSHEPFRGRFHAVEDFAFEPLPEQGATMPIVVGGGAPAALERIGRLADGYHSTGIGSDTYIGRAETIRRAAARAGRPEPEWSARIRVEPDRTEGAGGYALRGDPVTMAGGIDAWAAAGVTHLALYFDETNPDRLVRLVERFVREVVPLVRAPSPV
jgi:probable F420-dependent oxidoreductase